MKKITYKEAKEKYGIVISAMQRLDKIKFFLNDKGEVVDSLGDMRYIPHKNGFVSFLKNDKEVLRAMKKADKYYFR